MAEADVAVRKIFLCLLTLVFVQASLAGVVGPLCGTRAAVAGKSGCRITLDVCGHRAPAAAQTPAPLLNSQPDLESSFSAASVSPPACEGPVVSTEPGDAERPPKA